ncbi:MAG: hypothetical protein RL199_584 [Pseudomonadota bacterium]|jgi:superfamily II DNA or RNA helicase
MATTLHALLVPILKWTEFLDSARATLGTFPPGKKTHQGNRELRMATRHWGATYRATYFTITAAGELRTSCFCVPAYRGPKGCEHQLAFALELDAALTANDGTARPWLDALRWAVEPRPAEAVLGELARLMKGPAAKTASKPVWILRQYYGGRVQAELKRSDRDRHGGWAPPKAVAKGAAVTFLQTSPHPQDHEAARVAQAVRHAGWNGQSWDDALSAVVNVLFGHPDVHWDHFPSPVDVVPLRPTIHIGPRDDGIHVEVLLAGKPIPEGDALRVLDESARKLHVGRISERVRALAELCGSSAGLTVPRELGPRLLETLWDLAVEADFDLPEDLRPDEVACDGRIRVAFTREGEAWNLRLLVRPLGDDGPALPPGEESATVTGSRGGRATATTRRLEGEQLRAADVASILDLELGAPDWSAPLSFERTLDAASRLADRGDVVVEWPSRKPTLLSGRAKLRVEVGSAMDWFGVEGTAEVDGTKLALAHLLAARRQKKRYVEVSPDTFVDVAAVFDQRLEKLAQATHESHGKLVLSRAAAPDAPDLLEGFDEVEASTDWAQLVTRVREIRGWEPRLPRGLKTVLRDYQVAGFRWMSRLSRLGLGALLADDMGLGKTVQTIAMLLERAKGGPALVVAPTSVVFNWQRELQRFAPQLKVHLLRGSDRGVLLDDAGPNDVVIASWGLLRYEKERLSSRRWHTLVLDEAQFIKTWSTDTAKAARALKAEWRLGLTGTPVENHLGELYSLLETVVPGLFGSWEGFQRRFAAPIERAAGSEAKEAKDALSGLIGPFLLRRRKTQVALELPARTEVRLDVELTKLERELYEAERLRAVDAMADVEDFQTGRFKVLAALTRLRQLACNAHLVDDAAPAESSKTRVLVDQLEELVSEGRASLVFSQFASLLDLVSVALAKRGLDCLMLTGETPEAERKRRVDAFQKGAAKVFLISLKAGGTGLNLTAADTVFLVDPWWNPAAEDQAADRAHRMGQDKPVTIVRLVATGTIEEKVLELHAKKRGLVEGVLGDADLAGRLSTDELVDLLAGGGKVDTGGVAGDEDVPRPKRAPARPKSKSRKEGLDTDSVSGARLLQSAANRWTTELSDGTSKSHLSVLRRALGASATRELGMAAVESSLAHFGRGMTETAPTTQKAYRRILRSAFDGWVASALISPEQRENLLALLPG